MVKPLRNSGKEIFADVGEKENKQEYLLKSKLVISRQLTGQEDRKRRNDEFSEENIENTMSNEL